MNLEELFNQNNIIELSFFNFRNAITAAYFANKDLEIRRVNTNFKKFFPILGNVSNAYFPDVLEQLGLPSRQIDEFVTGLNENGSILIPQIEIEIEGKAKRPKVGEEIFLIENLEDKNKNGFYLN